MFGPSAEVDSRALVDKAERWGFVFLRSVEHMMCLEFLENIANTLCAHLELSGGMLSRLALPLATGAVARQGTEGFAR